MSLNKKHGLIHKEHEDVNVVFVHQMGHGASVQVRAGGFNLINPKYLCFF